MQDKVAEDVASVSACILQRSMHRSVPFALCKTADAGFISIYLFIYVCIYLFIYLFAENVVISCSVKCGVHGASPAESAIPKKQDVCCYKNFLEELWTEWF